MNINVGQSAKVVLPVKAASIKKTVKVGSNLEVHLANGSVITLENYFPNKPELLTNEGNNQATELTISNNGEVVGIKELNTDETASMLGNAYSSLTTQPNDILLLTANDANVATAGAKSYTVEVLAASAAILAGFFIAAHNDKSFSNNTANSKTITAPTQPSGDNASVGADGVLKGKDQQPGSTVVAKDANGNVIGSGVVGQDGSYSIPLNPAPKDGEKINIQVKDPAGNVAEGNVTVDTTPPTSPSAENGGVDANGVLHLQNQQPGSEVVVKDPNGNVIGKGVVDENGKAKIPLNPAPKEGGSVNVEIKDPSGNVSEGNVPVDTTAPTAPSNENSKVNGQGALELKDQQPGSEVVVKDPKGNVIGQGTVGNDGSANIPLNPAPKNGETLEVEITDPAGNKTTGKITAPDITAPTAPSNENGNVNGQGELELKDQQPGSEVVVKDPKGNVIGQGTVGNDGSANIPLNPAPKNGETLEVRVTDPAGNTTTGTITAPDTTAPEAPTGLTVSNDGLSVSGKGEPGATVTVKDKDGKVLGTAKADDQGNVKVSVTPAQTNGEKLDVTATDAKGNESAKAEVTAPDTTAPEAPTGLTVSNDGSSVSGKGEPGATVTVKDKDGKVLGTAKADDQGNFKVSVTPAQTNGEKLDVTATDAKGNESAKAQITAPDTTAPTAPSSENGSVNGQGELELKDQQPGSEVVVKDPKGNVIGQGTVGNDGSANIPLNPAPKNGETLEVKVTDPAGNTTTGKITAPDTTAPDAPTGLTVSNDGLSVSGKGEPGSTVTVKDKDGNVLGTAKADDQGNVKVSVTPAQTNGETLDVTATDAKGNESTKAQVTAPDTTAPDAPTGLTVSNDGLSVSGKGEPGSTVTVKDKDGKVLGTAKADDQGNFKVSVTPAQTNGEKLDVTATDAKGNESAKAEVTARDTTAPTIPEIALDDNGVLLKGTAEPGATVKVKSPEGKVITEVEADPTTGKFELTLPPNTTKNINVTATDEAGNESAPKAMELPDLSEPATAFYVEGTKIYTYFDTNHDGIVDKAEVTTYDKQVEVDTRTGKVINGAKPVEITNYFEPTDIAEGKGKLDTVRNEPQQKLAVTNPDQKEYIVYNPDDGSVKQRLYDLDAKARTGESVVAADGKTYPGIDKYETVEQVKVWDKVLDNGGKEVIELPLVVAYNNDAKGENDAKTYFQYNDKGLKTYAFFDDNGDGKIDRAEHYIYDANSDNPNPIKIEYDSDASNVVNKDAPSEGLSHQGTGYDKVEYYAYEELKTNVEGKEVVEYINTAKYTNLDNKATGEAPTDSEGNIIEINGERLNGIDTIEKNTFNDYGRKTKIEFDNNADGTADKIHYQKFDSLGRVTQVLVDNDAKENTGKAQTDNDGQSVNGIDQVLAYNYNVKGEVTEMKRDNNVDGKYDYREAYTLDANGFITDTAVDLTNDGKIDKVTKNTLNEKGEITVSEYYHQAADGTQTYTGKDMYTLDSNGHRTGKSSYTPTNALKSIETYELDGQGRVAKKLVDNGGNGIESAEIYTLDANGYVIKTENDIGNNGSIDSYTTNTLDALGRVVEVQSSSDGSTINRVTKNTYDVYGNVIRSESSNGLNQPVSSVMDTLYGSDNKPVWRYFDRTGNGVSADDTSYLDYYDAFGNRVGEKSFSGKVSYEDALAAVNGVAGSPKIAASLNMIYDDQGRQKIVMSDVNNDNNTIDLVNGTMSFPVRDNDRLTHNTEFSDVWNGRYTKQMILTYFGTNAQTQSYDDTGAFFNGTIDNRNDGVIDIYTYGDTNGKYGVDRTDNWTQWTDTKVNELKGLNEIRLSMTASTNITLDSETISQLAPIGRVGNVSNTLTIKGDGDDTVNLAGSDFTKLSTTYQSGSDTFDMYSTEVDGKTYTLYIDNDIQTVIG